MTRRISAVSLLVASVVALSACGLTYTSPTVQKSAQGMNVRVVPLTASTVQVANVDPYKPRVLPAAFYQTAGGGQLRGAGAVPPAPFVPEETRTPLELRLPPPAVAPQYRIGIGDVLLLATKSAGSTVEELAGLLAAQSQRQGYTVRDDGAIAIPDIGLISVAGRTVQDAEAAVFQALVDRQLDPAFSLEVSDFNSKRVAVGGEVGRAMLVPITLTTLNLGEALNAAGGIQVENEQFASIRLYRGGELYQIPIQTFYDRPELQQLVLLDGDAVYVDTSYDLDKALLYYRTQLDVIGLRSQTRQTALSELEAEISLRRAALNEQRTIFQSRESLGAEARDYIYLAGEVSRQGRFVMPYNQQVTLADVLYDKGGFPTISGDASEIYVLRAVDEAASDANVTAWHLNARNAAQLTIATQMQMRPNDIVFVEEQPITKWSRALNQFFPTLLNAGVRSLN
ncbi:MAG: polysaccharide biosynthesis/export family protein [Rhodobacteraceae bacterium]|nr:polysaccharide biosynthesis/export family protein [Paracoccaceae bacterium]